MYSLSALLLLTSIVEASVYVHTSPFFIILGCLLSGPDAVISGSSIPRQLANHQIYRLACQYLLRIA